MSEQGKATAMPKSGIDSGSGWVELLQGRNAIYSLALGGSVTLHALNIYIAITIMPSVVAEVGGLDYYAWSTTLFVVASILGSAISARLLQRVGARGAYAAAALVFGAGTVICALAPSMPLLLTGRFVQGFGGGLLYALAYGVIRLIFPEHLWARAIGLISAMWGIATLTGPAIGGVFAEIGAWRAAFWSLIPFITIFAIMAFATLPGKGDSDETPSRLPFPQLTLLTASVIMLSAGSLGDALFWNVIGIGGTVALAGLLVAVELRSETRLLPRGALKRDRAAGCSLRRHRAFGDRHAAGDFRALSASDSAWAIAIDRRLSGSPHGDRLDAGFAFQCQLERPQRAAGDHHQPGVWLARPHPAGGVHAGH